MTRMIIVVHLFGDFFKEKAKGVMFLFGFAKDFWWDCVILRGKANPR